MVLDYTSAVEERSDEVREGHVPLLLGAIQTGFFSEAVETCRYCRARLAIPVQEVEDGGGGYDSVFRLLACDTCGWWYQESLDETYLGDGARLATRRHPPRPFRDGGLDLLLVQGETNWVVQVKRRRSAGRAEGVDVIRDLVGAMTLAQQRRGIFVTTADRYTRGARKTAARADAIGAVDSIELIDFARFAALLELTFDRAERPWQVALDEWRRPTH
jgi:hypothetical protein